MAPWLPKPVPVPLPPVGTVPAGCSVPSDRRLYTTTLLGPAAFVMVYTAPTASSLPWFCEYAGGTSPDNATSARNRIAMCFFTFDAPCWDCTYGLEDKRRVRHASAPP